MCHNQDNLRSNNKDLQVVEKQLDRRNFLTKTSMGLGAIALGSLLNGEKALAFVKSNNRRPSKSLNKNILGLPHHLPKAKRIVYLFQSGGPSQLDMWDYKPQLKSMFGQHLPDSVRQGQRLTAMSAEQSIYPIAHSIFNFKQYGQSGTWASELLPHTSKVVDDLCFIKSMQTDHGARQVLKFIGSNHGSHGNNARFLVGNFNTYCSFSWNGSNDSNTQCR